MTSPHTNPPGDQVPDEPDRAGHADLDLDQLQPDQLEPELLAALDLWAAQRDVAGGAEPMPDAVRERSLRTASLAIGGLARTAPDGTPRPMLQTEAAARSRRRPWIKPLAIGIVGGAAVLAAALVTANSGDPSEQRDAFIANNVDAIVATLRLRTDPLAHCGNVAWSPDRREAFVFAANMPANDPARQRYTLWAETGDQRVEIARFDVTDPVDEIVRLRGLPELDRLGGQPDRFVVTLDAVAPGVEPASIEIATTDAF